MRCARRHCGIGFKSTRHRPFAMFAWMPPFYLLKRPARGQFSFIDGEMDATIRNIDLNDVTVTDQAYRPAVPRLW